MRKHILLFVVLTAALFAAFARMPVSFVDDVSAQIRRVTPKQGSKNNPSRVATPIVSEGFDGTPLSSWTALQYENVAEPIFTQSTEMVYSGTHSVRIDHDGSSWGSTLSRQLGEPITGDFSVAIYDDMSNPDAYIYLGLSLADIYAQQTNPAKGGLSIGIYPVKSQDEYVYCSSQKLEDCIATGVKRSVGWHKFHLVVTPVGSYPKIDGYNLSHLPKKGSSYAINTSYVQAERLNIGVNAGADVPPVHFDDVNVYALQKPISELELVGEYIDYYLSSYGKIDIQAMDAMIKARRSDFCDVDYDWVPGASTTCPTTGQQQRPLWHYKEQLFHMYDAMLLTAGAHSIRYLKKKDPSDLEKAQEIFTYINGEYGEWSQRETQCGNKHCNTGAIVGMIMAHNVWLVWDHLDPRLQRSIADNLSAEAEFFYKYFVPFNGHIGNSGGEENSWVALYLDRLSLIFRQRAQSKLWYDKAKFFAFHSLTRQEEYGGVTTRTVYDDYLFDNHLMHPHPSYGMVTAMSLGGIDLLRKKVTGETTPEYLHNAREVWDVLSKYVLFQNFQYKGGIVHVDEVDPVPYEKQETTDSADPLRTEDAGRYDSFPARSLPGTDVIFTGSGVQTAHNDTSADSNSFNDLGKNDWGDDAVSLTHYFIVRDAFGIKAVQDPATGFATDDIAAYALTFNNYIKRGSLWKPAPKDVVFNEMLLEEWDVPGRDDRPSYVWFRNSMLMWEYASYHFYFDNDVTLPALKVCEDDIYKLRRWEGDITWGCVSDGAKEGMKSLALTIETPSNVESYSPLIAVKPSTAYTVSYWVRSENVEVESADVVGKIVPSQFSANSVEADPVNSREGDGISVGRRLEAGFELGQNAVNVAEWTRRSYSFTTHPDAGFIRLRAIVGVGKAKGKFFFDGIQLAEGGTAESDVDANADGAVDGIDYVVWLKNFGRSTEVTTQTGDYNKDGIVNGDDFNVWYNIFKGLLTRQ